MLRSSWTTCIYMFLGGGENTTFAGRNLCSAHHHSPPEACLHSLVLSGTSRNKHVLLVNFETSLFTKANEVNLCLVGSSGNSAFSSGDNQSFPFGAIHWSKECLLTWQLAIVPLNTKDPINTYQADAIFAMMALRTFLQLEASKAMDHPRLQKALGQGQLKTHTATPDH